MRKVSLFFLVAALLGAALILGGCGNPTNGDDGAAGQTVGFIVSGTVNAADLAAAFKLTNVLTLGSGVTSVYGEVPADKKLAVAGTSTAVTAGEILEINGTLEVYEGAKLNASYVSTAGYLKGTAANVSGKGTVTLPYIKSTVPDAPTDIITYTDTLTGIVKSVGAYLTTSAAAPGGALNNTEIVSFWKDVTDLDELTVGNITGLTAGAVPADKTLTLTGTGNTVTENLNLASAGELIVDGTLTTSGAVTITGNATTTITTNGTLALGASGTVAGEITNNGTISSSTGTPATQKTLISTPGGTGTVVLSGGGTGVVDTAALKLTQNVEIASGGKLMAPVFAAPFSGDKTITVDAGGTLDLGAVPASASYTGVTIENKGTVTTATTSVKALGTIAALGGTITSSGDVGGNDNLTIPKGTTLTHDSGTFVGGTGTITVAGKATFTTGTFASQTGKITVEKDGNATFTVGTLATVTTLEVNGTLFALAATLAAIDATTDITGTGTLVIGAAMDATKVKFVIESALKGANIGSAAITAASGLTIPAGTYRVFTGAAAPTGDVTVNGMLGVSGTGSLTIAAGKTLANAGTIALTETGSVVLTGADATGGALLKGAGKLTAGKTEIVGGTSNGWQAVGAGTVTIAAATADTASITASAATTVFTAQGTGATITQLEGSGNGLTIAANTTVDLGTGGTLTLTGAAGTDGAALKGAGKVAFGNASITGGNGAWQAVGASTTIAFSSSSAAAAAITGTGTSPALTGVTNDEAAITLGAGNTAGDQVELTVTNATIDIETKGSVVFKHTATASTLVLKGGSDVGALKLGAGTTDTTNTKLTSDSKVVVIGGTGIVEKGTGDNPPVAGLISGGAAAGTNDATITGQTATNDVTVKAGATLVS